MRNETKEPIQYIFGYLKPKFYFWGSSLKIHLLLLTTPVSQPWWLKDLSPGEHPFPSGLGDHNLTRLYLDEKFWQMWRRCTSNYWLLSQSEWQVMLGRDEKCCQDLLIFKISLRVLVLLVRRLFLRPESFGKYARRDFAGAMAVVLMTKQNQTGHDCHDCRIKRLVFFCSYLQKHEGAWDLKRKKQNFFQYLWQHKRCISSKTNLLPAPPSPQNGVAASSISCRNNTVW